MIDGHDPSENTRERPQQLPSEEVEALGGLTLESSEVSLITPDDENFEDSVFEGILAFVEDRGSEPFTYADMEASLPGIELRGSADKKHELLAEMLDEAVAIVDEQSPDEVITHARIRVGKQLGFVVASAGPKAPKKLPALPLSRPARASEPTSMFQRPLSYTRAEAESTDVPKHPHEEQYRKRVISLLKRRPDLRGNQIRNQVSEMLDLPGDETQELLGRMIDDGVLFRAGKGTHRRYSWEPIPEEEVGKQPAKKSKPEGLSERGKRIAPSVLDVVSRETHVTQLLTPRQVVNRIKSLRLSGEDVSERDVKSIARQLERQGIMLQTRARQGKKAPRSKRVEVMKVGLASQHVKDLYKTDAGRAAILELTRNGGQFMPPDVSSEE